MIYYNFEFCFNATGLTEILNKNGFQDCDIIEADRFTMVLGSRAATCFTEALDSLSTSFKTMSEQSEDFKVTEFDITTVGNAEKIIN